MHNEALYLKKNKLACTRFRYFLNPCDIMRKLILVLHVNLQLQYFYLVYLKHNVIFSLTLNIYLSLFFSAIDSIRETLYLIKLLSISFFFFIDGTFTDILQYITKEKEVFFTEKLFYHEMVSL